MNIVGASLPTLAKGKSLSGIILDVVFRNGALWLQNPEVFEKLPGVPLPLLGFAYEQPNTLEFLRYRYAEYPYLNKAVVANAFIKEAPSIAIRALRPITKFNNILINYTMNSLLIKGIEKYADKGGLFSLNTMWGLQKDLALESLAGETFDNQGGVVFSFQFKKLNFDDTTLAKSVSARLISLSTGAGA